ncbi:MAG: G8 domain-containing protein [Bacteroidota bacterium]
MGILQIGSKESPFQNKATITLTGPKEDVNNMGGRFLVTMDGGSLQLYGASASKLSWGQLEGSIAPGATEMMLDKEPNGWESGDKIAVAPSGYDPFEAEEVTITSVNGKRISFTPALRYAHYGEIQEYEGKVLDERAEVGLLTRNIKIQGASDAVDLKFGGHTMVMNESGAINIEGVEFTRMGQPGIEARYNFHWHLAGDREGDYIKNSSIHHSLQRGVVVHQTNNVLVEDVVTFNVQNHAFIPAEDGNEVNNTFRNNLSILNRLPDKGLFAFPVEGKETSQSRQGEHRVAGFWARNPHNNLIGNHVAGSERGIGFFFDGFAKDRLFKDFDVLPREIIFSGNVVHSCSVPGVNNNAGTNVATYGKVGHGHGLFIDGFNNGDLMWTFSDFTAYKNAMSAVWSEMLNVTLDNFIVADNSSAFLTSRSFVQNSLVIGKSRNDIDGPNRVLRDGHKRAGFYSIAQGGPKQPKFSNVTFININQDVAGEDIAAAVVGSSGNYGENYFENIKLINSQPIYMRTKGSSHTKPTGAFIFDKDGSLTRYDKPVIIVHEYSTLINDAAIYHEDWRAYVLDAENIMQLRFNDIPFYLDISLTRDDGKFIAPNQAGKTFHFGVEGRTGHRFQGEWSVDEDGQAIYAKSILKQPGNWTIVRYPYPYEVVNVTNMEGMDIAPVNSENDLINTQTTSYYFDKNNKEVVVKLVTDLEGLAFARINAGEGIDVGDGITSTQAFQDIINVAVTPNPLTNESALNYTLLKEQFVGIAIFHMTGRKLKVISAEQQDAGSYTVPLDNLYLQSGVYAISFRLADQDVAVKVIKQ